MKFAASYQSEDQVVECCSGKQEQQDGEQQRPNEELEHQKHKNTHSKHLNLRESYDYSVPVCYLVQVIGAGVHPLPQDVPLLPSEEPPER